MQEPYQTTIKGISLPVVVKPLHLEAVHFQQLFKELGPSLGLWRAAEVAVLRSRQYERPIVEVGCGDGFVASMVLPGIEIGCDPWTAALERAARRGVYTQLLPVPIEHAEIEQESAATVICNSVLEHIPSLEPVFHAIGRILRPGGHVVISGPSEKFTEWLAFPFRSYRMWRNRRLQHFNLWSAEEWFSCLGRFGFAPVSIAPYLRRSLVALWDAMDLLEQVWVAKRRLAGLLWRALPFSTLYRISRLASRIDLSAPFPGGGHLIIARKE